MKNLSKMKKVKYLIYSESDTINRLPNSITIDIEGMPNDHILSWIEDQIRRKYSRKYNIIISHTSRTVKLSGKVFGQNE